jgi:hypothetical protein
MRRASEVYTFTLEDFWTKFGLKVLFRIPSIWKHFDSFFNNFHFHSTFHNRDISNSSLTVSICYPQRFCVLLGFVLKCHLIRFFLVICPFENFLLCFVMRILIAVLTDIQFLIPGHNSPIRRFPPSLTFWHRSFTFKF